MSRRLLVGFATLMIVTTAVFVLINRGQSDKGSGGWPTTKVALASVQRTDVPRAFHGVGELEGARQIELSSEIAGRITRIAFSSGHRVEKGQLLVQINDAPEQADRLRLQAQLRNAETALARTRSLLADKVASQAAHDNAEMARDMAQSELQRIEAVIAQKTIVAPFSGVIGIRRVHEGQYLRAGDAIASLVDTGILNVNFALNEQAVPHLKINQTVQLRVDAWPEKIFSGTVTATDPLISKSRTILIQAAVPNDDGLLQAGMFASLQVHQPQPISALAIPETAVTYTAYGQSVFVARQNERQALIAHRVAVKTGERWQGRVEIETGLNEGDRVVTSGQLKLSDGMPIEVLAADALHDGKPALTEGKPQ